MQLDKNSFLIFFTVECNDLSFFSFLISPWPLVIIQEESTETQGIFLLNAESFGLH